MKGVPLSIPDSRQGHNLPIGRPYLDGTFLGVSLLRDRCVLSLMRYRGAVSHGNASTICLAVHSAVGFAGTLEWSARRMLRSALSGSPWRTYYACGFFPKDSRKVIRTLPETAYPGRLPLPLKVDQPTSACLEVRLLLCYIVTRMSLRFNRFCLAPRLWTRGRRILPIPRKKSIRPERGRRKGDMPAISPWNKNNL